MRWLFFYHPKKYTFKVLFHPLKNQYQYYAVNTVMHQIRKINLNFLQKKLNCFETLPIKGLTMSEIIVKF